MDKVYKFLGGQKVTIGLFGLITTTAMKLGGQISADQWENTFYFLLGSIISGHALTDIASMFKRGK